MGRVRDFEYDAVIGVGGDGPEPRANDIARKITWVGIHPKWLPGTFDGQATLVEFKHFVLLDSEGPSLESLAPHLAQRMYQRAVRFILDSYSEDEQADAQSIIEWALTLPSNQTSTEKAPSCESSCNATVQPTNHFACTKCGPADNHSKCHPPRC